MIRSDECLADVIALRTVSKSFVAPAVMQNCLKLSGSYTWIPFFYFSPLYVLPLCHTLHETKKLFYKSKTKKMLLEKND